MSFSSHIQIGPHRVGPGCPVLIIAEAGVSHFGDPQKALDLVDLAAESGAQVFKTQAFNTDELIAERLPEWRERLRPKEIGFDFLAAMKERCDEKDIVFMCTAHDESVLPWLDQLDVPAFKIGSGERGNLPFFEAHAERGKPIILSTGMYTEAHVREAVDCFAGAGHHELALLHCTTSYPIPYDQVNLRGIETLRTQFPGPVGYSDHTDDHHAVIAAVALGATIVEKHITLDFNVPNAQDWKVSAGPDDLAQLVKRVRETEAALGNGHLEVQTCEEPALEWALKSLVSRRALSAGHVIQASDLVAKRPGDAVPPSERQRLIGKRLLNDIPADAPIQMADVQAETAE